MVVAFNYFLPQLSKLDRIDKNNYFCDFITNILYDRSLGWNLCTYNDHKNTNHILCLFNLIAVLIDVLHSDPCDDICPMLKR